MHALSVARSSRRRGKRASTDDVVGKHATSVIPSQVGSIADLFAARARFRLSLSTLGRPNRFLHAVPPVAVCGLAAAFAIGCSNVDPGSNFAVAEETFNEDYFFCHVEPELIFAKRCGPGDPNAGDPSSGCHFNAAAVSGMALIDHPAIDCGGGDHPLSRAQVGVGGPARGNLQAVSLVMSRDYLTAPLYLRPTGANHPRAVFAKDDPVVEVIKTWALRP